MAVKSLTLYQPWASLIAIGAKKIETRGWNTKYRGELAIHASAKFTNRQRELCRKEPFAGTLLKANLYVMEHCLKLREYNMLPFGVVIAVCNLVDCLEIDESGLYAKGKTGDPLIDEYAETLVRVAPLPSEPELSFGDFTPGRYAWILEDIRQLREPIPVSGRQKLWEWEPPEVNAGGE